MKIEIIDIKKIKENASNPRFITDDKFAKLVKSIKAFPKMLELRPIVVNADMVVLGGNMRLKACLEAGLKKVPVINAADLTEDQQSEFIIKDNVGFGQWDWDVLANEWKDEQLEDWGMDVIKHDWDDLDFIEEEQETPNVDSNKLVIIIPDELMDDKAQIETAISDFLSENYSGCEVK